ncbi:MAG: hypothetical protein ABMA25_18885 [Ilumatobacteraceae bacterium]
MLIGEGGYQEFSLGPEVNWLPVVVALALGAVVGGAAVALYLRRRTSPHPVYVTPQRPVLVPPTGERAEPISIDGLDWDAGAPMPVVISTDRRTLFACHLLQDDEVVVAEFVRCTSVRKGLPNDEVVHGLPFAAGLDIYGVNVIHGSRWLYDLQQIESVHERSAGHPIFSEQRHFFLGLKDTSLEAIAKDLVVIGRFPTMDDAIAEMLRLTAID